MPLFGRNKNADKNRGAKDEGIPEDREEKKTAGSAPEPKEEPEQPKEPEQAKQAEPVEIDPGSVPDAAATPIQPIQPTQTREEAPRPRFHTPEGFEFNRYFLAERRIMLENVSYETGRLSPGQTQYKLNARDTIVAQVLGQAGVKVTYNRTLSFEPEGPFTLSVSFSVMLVFNPGTRGEIDWKTVDLAEEFKKNCPQLIQTMMVKATLLIGEITAANGAPILPMPPRA
ncbi:MAG: hypothetical protein II680_07240 [Clostridia bacterium]|nr:hypothetical protein [Clostridia bacterium]